MLELWAVYALMQMPGMLGSSGTDPEGLGKAICLSTIKRIAVAHRCHTYSAEGVVFVPTGAYVRRRRTQRNCNFVVHFFHHVVPDF